MRNKTVINEDKKFEKINYTEKTLRNREFFQCDFIRCNFTESDLRGNTFEDCTFENCNFSMTSIDGTGFRNVLFLDSKILGIDFSKCNEFMFSFKFENCLLDYSTFFRTKMQKTAFINCSLKQVDFSEVDLTSSLFTNSDLTGALFSRTVLEKVDFSNAQNFAIDPEQNSMKKAKFSANQLESLLYKYDLTIL
ncbi:pentapeptide repeat-containing protein [Zunongwangia sp.]|uniref:pentapeptide repeat-containing protein n=1 Tax=Zunongwangia sp. TaxID=1965325 RepID=UPI003AA7E343